MATQSKKSQAKKPSKEKVATATVAEPAVRGEPAPKPVLANAVKPDEKLLAAGTLNGAVDTLEKSLKATVPAAIAVNRMLFDIAQANMNSGMELARDLAGARTPMEALRLGMNYWHDNADVFQSQARELRTLSAKLLTTASGPLRAQLRRG